MKKVGDTVSGHFPWLPGIKTGKIVAKRVPAEGEYFLSGWDAHPIVVRNGSGYLSKRDAEREHLIVELDENEN